MRIEKNKIRESQIVIRILLMFWVYLFVIEKFLMENAMIVPLEQINSENVWLKLLGDIVSMWVIPITLIIVYRKRIAMFCLSFVSLKLCGILIASLFIFFLLHGDYSIRGIYKLWFYVFIVGFSEEVIFRGYAYNFLVPINRMRAIAISGGFFGTMHTIVPALVGDLSLSRLIVAILSSIGGGIVSGLLFIYLEEKSKTLFVPILVHALLDYSYKMWGLVIAIAICVFYVIKGKKEEKTSCIL